MRKGKNLNDFIGEMEMTVLPQEELILLGAGGEGESGTNPGCNVNSVEGCQINNCNSGNCIKGCG